MTTRPPSDLNDFCRAVYPRLVGAMALYVGDVGVAGKLAQEALLRLSLRWDRVREMESPEAWAHRVAINLGNSWFRRRAAAWRAEARLGRGLAPPAADADDAITVRRAVAALPRRKRAAIVLRYFNDLPVSEVAAALNVSPGAVRTLTHRAVRALAAQLDTDPNEMLEEHHAH